MSDDDTGLVLVGVALFFAVLGYLLSRAGLKRIDDATPEVRSAVVADQMEKVNEALEGLTGAQAPARVAWTFCALCLAGAFVAFGLISLRLGG